MSVRPDRKTGRPSRRTVPPAPPSAAALVRALADALDAGRNLVGFGASIVPSLYVVGLAPEELAALSRMRALERYLALVLSRLARRRRYLTVGPIEVSLWAQPGVAPGSPAIAFAFRESEALALSEAAIRLARMARHAAAG